MLCYVFQPVMLGDIVWLFLLCYTAGFYYVIQPDYAMLYCEGMLCYTAESCYVIEPGYVMLDCGVMLCCTAGLCNVIQRGYVIRCGYVMLYSGVILCYTTVVMLCYIALLSNVRLGGCLSHFKAKQASTLIDRLKASASHLIYVFQSNYCPW